MEAAARVYRDAKQQHERDDLILEHLGYVRHIVGRIVGGLPYGVDQDNLLSAGTLGLVEAARNFDPCQGVEFRTFAFQRIRGAIIDELRRNCPVPQRVLRNIATVRSAIETLPAPATIEDIAGETGLTTDCVEESLEASRLTRQESWSEWDSGRPVHGRIPEGPVSALERIEQKELLASCIERLPQRDGLILTLYYTEELRLKEIGAVLGLSESRVSRLLSRAEHNLRERMRAYAASDA